MAKMYLRKRPEIITTSLTLTSTAISANKGAIDNGGSASYPVYGNITVTLPSGTSAVLMYISYTKYLWSGFTVVTKQVYKSALSGWSINIPEWDMIGRLSDYTNAASGANPVLSYSPSNRIVSFIAGFTYSGENGSPSTYRPYVHIPAVTGVSAFSLVFECE